MSRLALTLLLALSACADPSGDYPRLLPTDRILAEPVLPAHVAIPSSPAAVETELASRAGDLASRADALRGPVIEPEFRDQMAGAAARAR